MEKSNRLKVQDTNTLQEKQSYSSPTVRGVSIAMEYSIASGSQSGNVGPSELVTEEWDQESVQSKEFNW